MTFQTINGHFVYVVQIDSIPKRPLSYGKNLALKPYAEALNTAIAGGMIKEPGKYAVEVHQASRLWDVYRVQE